MKSKILGQDKVANSKDFIMASACSNVENIAAGNH